MGWLDELEPGEASAARRAAATSFTGGWCALIRCGRRTLLVGDGVPLFVFLANGIDANVFALPRRVLHQSPSWSRWRLRDRIKGAGVGGVPFQRQQRRVSL